MNNLQFCFILFSVVLYAIALEQKPDSETITDFWEPIWTWKCNETTDDGPSCIRHDYNRSESSEIRQPLKTCWLTCGPNGPLWPIPTGNTQLGKELTAFLPSNVQLASVIPASGPIRGFVEQAYKIIANHVADIYNNGLQESSPDLVVKNDNLIQLHLRILDTSVMTVKLDNDESYQITVTKNPAESVIEVTITGNTYFGVRHGLETFTQLIAFNEDEQLLNIVNEATIEDKPAFRYRGLLIDTGRNFIPIPNLKRMVDAMAYNKLNMFHWHLSDSNSIPFLSKRVPQVTKYGILGPKKLYRPEEIAEFISYANIRGVKIIPELDAPSHAGNGWQWGPQEGLGELSLCVNAEPYRDYCIQPPCGQLNPLNNNTLVVLGKLFADFLDVFDRDFFHMGNDEISFKCWLKYQEINDWLAQRNNSDIMDLWGMFQENSLKELKAANDGRPLSAIVWTSDMTENGRKYLPVEDYVIHIWHPTNDSQIKDVLLENYRVIFSNKDVVYLDHGYGPWRNLREQPKLNLWQEVYDYDILKLVDGFVGEAKREELVNAGNIFGGQACLWSEKVDRHNMEMKLWPRGAALAERLWSNPTTEPRFAYPRLILHRERMIVRGIHPDTLLPESCHHILGFCDDPQYYTE